MTSPTIASDGLVPDDWGLSTVVNPALEERRALMRSLRAEGLTHKQIAESLGVSRSTVTVGLATPPKVVDPVQRFMARVEVQDPPHGCWIWQQRTFNGYGRYSFNKTEYIAHRYGYELLVGPIPDGMQLDHLCRVRECVNPDHLEPVTPKENSHRSANRFVQASLANECLQGHSFDDPNNVYVRPNGRRTCRACRRLRESGPA